MPYEAVIQDACEIVAEAAEAAGTRQFVFRGMTIDPFAAVERLSVAEAFQRYAGIDLLRTVSGGEGDRALLAELAASKVKVAEDDTWSDIFSKVLVEHIEPRLGRGRLTVLHEYPAPESALARVCAHDDRIAERFELYACGVELANGFGELTDAVEQRRRFEAAMSEKQRLYGERYPIDEDFLAAVAVMPEASGVALGFDRLVMLAAGALRIDQVVWMPPSEDA
jgi:lysyl-tRNA synthetase class 2